MYISLIKRDRFYLLLIILIFTGAVLVGEFLPELSPGFAKVFETAIGKRLTEIVERMKELPVWGWILLIFLNNLNATFIAVIAGLLLSPVFPLIILIMNGTVMGLFQRKTELLGLSFGRYYFGLLPHGIFELPALFLAILMGIKLGRLTYGLIWRFLKGDRSFSFSQEWLNGISSYFKEEGRYYSVLVITLLVVAAVIESTISPMVIKGN